VALLLVLLTLPLGAQGVNLSGWLQPASAGQTPFSRYSQADFRQLALLGVTTVRLPINLLAYVGTAPEFRLDARLFAYLDQAVAWAHEQNFTLVIDNHGDPLDKRVVGRLGEYLSKVWAQLAKHYRDQPASVVFELQNEPHDLPASLWASAQQTAVAAIRAADPDRILVVTGADWGGIDGLLKLPVLADKHLWYSFHIYDPFEFTHQGADWAGRAGLTGVRFSASKSEVDKLAASLDKVRAFADAHGVKVFCGEFGVFDQFANPADRVLWYRTLRTLLDERHIPWTMWDYRGSFGLFLPGTPERFDSDLNVAQAQALGFHSVPQTAAPALMVFSGGPLYRDAWESGTEESAWIRAGQVDFADPRAPHAGAFSLKLRDLAQYDKVGWDFRTPVDLSALAANGKLVVWLRASAPFSLELRFVDEAGGDGSLPWRMAFTVDERVVPADGAWHPVEVPLASMVETGAWDGSGKGRWFGAQPGSFRWNRVKTFEVVAEARSLPGVELGFDDLELR
jgi:endoglucanase